MNLVMSPGTLCWISLHSTWSNKYLDRLQESSIIQFVNSLQLMDIFMQIILHFGELNVDCHHQLDIIFFADCGYLSQQIISKTVPFFMVNTSPYWNMSQFSEPLTYVYDPFGIGSIMPSCSKVFIIANIASSVDISSRDVITGQIHLSTASYDAVHSRIICFWKFEMHFTFAGHLSM